MMSNRHRFTVDQQETLSAMGAAVRNASGHRSCTMRLVHEDSLGHLKINALKSLVIGGFLTYREDGFYSITRKGWTAYKGIQCQEGHLSHLRRGDTFQHGNTEWEVTSTANGHVVYVTYNEVESRD